MTSEETVRFRLQELRQELEIGSRQLEALERKRDETRETLLRIKGAIQVLEELSAHATAPGDQETRNIPRAVKS